MTAQNAPRSGEQIQAALRLFVDRWANYSGGEREEAQSYLNDLVSCYGVDRFAAGMRFEYHVPRVGFMDLFWPGRALVEMKAPSRTQDLEHAQPQAERYWRASDAPDESYPAVRYVVLCSFQRLLIWDMHQRPSRPMASLQLEELPDHYEALLFLAGGTTEASFVEHHRELTRAAAERVAQLYQSLKDRNAAAPDELQRFVMQCVWTMFAEKLGMITGYPLQRIVSRLRKEKEPNTARDLGYLFRVMNQKGSQNRKGELGGTRYVNGELFDNPAEVDLNPIELTLLAQAAEFDWSRVDPTIFGSLMEGVLGRDRRWELGAHYTHEADIMKIVGPTIVAPWQLRIDDCAGPSQARALLEELCAFTVLDPACGCGNFLYVAYRELRGLEAELKRRIRELAVEQGLPAPPAPWPYVRLTNFQGIDIERIAVMIARVTLWMGHRQMIERYGEAEAPLPLVSLPGIRVGDALRIDWPVTNCIIGNPPFLGSQHIREAFGGEYVDWLKAAFGVGVKDFCVYWFRRAHDHLEPGQRAGLVGTNSISQNRARSASLEYIVSHGGRIVDAVSSQVWPGDAKVHVSLVNWVRGGAADQPRLLDGLPVTMIGPDLRASGKPAPAVLIQNRNRCFQGPIPVGAGFIVTEVEALDMLAASKPHYADVVKRFLTAEDIAEATDHGPRRWIIDFAQMPLEAARKFPAATRIVEQRVRPFRETVNREGHRRRWWQFGEPRVGMRKALVVRSRFCVIAAHAKRVILTWADADIIASNACMVFAFDDDFSMGVLQSRIHVSWAWAQSSTLKRDLRYTPTSVFMTFPWPDLATAVQRDVVGRACVALLERRDEICRADAIGLTLLYNAMDDGAYTDVRALHRELDEAVAACYGWPKSVAQGEAEIVSRLTDLNRQITTGERAYEPFAYLDEVSP